MSPRVSAIVLVHNQLTFAKRCLSSLFATHGLDEVVVVDNGSAAPVSDYLASLKGTEELHAGAMAQRDFAYSIIRNDRNVGGSKARNQGVQASGGDLLLFFDSDAFASDPRWLYALRESLSVSPNIAAAAPMLVYPEEGIFIQSAGGGATERGHFGLIGRGEYSDITVYSKVRQVAWAPAACLLCCRSIYERVGGFSETFDPISVGEDIDLCLAIRSHGASVWYYPSVRVFHYEGQTFDRVPYLARRKKEAFIRNTREIRRRWPDVIRSGPLCTDDDIRYVYIEKNYSNPDAPLVLPHRERLASYADPYWFQEEAPEQDEPTR